MFNLIANAMFEATRMSAPETAKPRNRWFSGGTGARTPRSDLPGEQPGSGPNAAARNGTASGR